MRNEKVRRNKTVTLSPYGKIPIRDATKDVYIPLSQKNLQKGKPRKPSVCAVALEIRDQRHLFPSKKVLGAWTYKSYTLIVGNKNNKIQARRYVHSDSLRRSINGFDVKIAKWKRIKYKLRAKDIIGLLAPRRYNKLGLGKHSEHFNSDHKRKRSPTDWKRGVFTDDLHTKLAQQDCEERTSVVE